MPRQIRRVIAPQTHGMVLMDQAGRHMPGQLTEPGNISIILLPPKCLN